MSTDAKHAYRESAVHSASPVRLVMLLYEQIVQDLQCALNALERNDIEQRSREMDRALAIVGQLQATLDLDHGRRSSQESGAFLHLAACQPVGGADQPIQDDSRDPDHQPAVIA